MLMMGFTLLKLCFSVMRTFLCDTFYNFEFWIEWPIKNEKKNNSNQTLIIVVQVTN